MASCLAQGTWSAALLGVVGPWAVATATILCRSWMVGIGAPRTALAVGTASAKASAAGTAGASAAAGYGRAPDWCKERVGFSCAAAIAGGERKTSCSAGQGGARENQGASPAVAAAGSAGAAPWGLQGVGTEVLQGWSGDGPRGPCQRQRDRLTGQDKRGMAMTTHPTRSGAGGDGQSSSRCTAGTPTPGPTCPCLG